jgi:uncharacterized protein
MDECFAEFTTAINRAAADGLQDLAGRLRAGSQDYLEYSRTAPRRYLLLATHPDLPRQNKGSGGDDPASAAFRTLVKAVDACIQAGVSASTDAFGDAVCVWGALHGYAIVHANLTKFPWPDGNFVLDHLITASGRPATAGPPAAAGGPPVDPHHSDGVYVMIEAHSTALVTGASSGSGEQLARQLAARGVNLVLVARSEQRLRALAEELETAHRGVSVTVMTADLSAPDAPGDLAGKLAAAGVTVDLLVNNAGFASYGPFADEDPDRLAREIQQNCSALVTLTARLLPPMLARGRGGVLNVASTAGFQPVPTMAVYGASKAFVLSFTEALWAETRASRVRVLALCPGPTQTRFFETAGNGKEFLTRGRQTPERVAAAALRAFESGRGPSVTSGTSNRLLSSGYRFFPRSVMARMAQRNVRAA